MFCSSCGNQASGKFCTNCGSPIIQPVIRQEPKTAPLTENLITTSPPDISNKDENISRYFEIGNESEAGEKVSVSNSIPRKRRRGLLISLFVIVVIILFPTSGPLQVIYKNETQLNPPTGFEINLNGKSSKFAGVNYDGQVIARDSWGGLAPIKLTFSPNPQKDEVVRFEAPFFTNLGIWNVGRVKSIVVRVNDSAVTVELDSREYPIIQFSSSGTRSDYKAEFSACEAVFDGLYGKQLNLLAKANENYLRYVDEERLSGEQWLYYTTWAYRSDALQGRLTNYLGLIDPNLGVPSLQSLAGEVVSALQAVRSAWQNLESVSRLEAESRWDSAWDTIRSAEADLQTASNSFVTQSAAASKLYCQALLDR